VYHRICAPFGVRSLSVVESKDRDLGREQNEGFSMAELERQPTPVIIFSDYV
jgi:hypothetical protein